MTAEQKGFNADQRAKERAEQPVTIGGTVFIRRRSTNDLQRELLRLARDQDRVNRRQEQLADLIDAIDAREQEEIDRLLKVTGADTQDVDKLTEQLDALGEDARKLTYQMIVVQLRSQGDDQAPEMAFLEENLDYEDVMPLVRYLSGKPADPQTQTPSEAGSG